MKYYPHSSLLKMQYQDELLETLGVSAGDYKDQTQTWKAALEAARDLTKTYEMNKVYEVGYSKVTGEWFVVSHDGTEGEDGFDSRESAEKAAIKKEEV